MYPIIFSARHGIELILKDVLQELPKIRPITVIKPNIFKTHDLLCLWNELKTISSTVDRRYEEIVLPLDEHIKDYASIDPTGQTFRYPNDEYKTIHLKHTPIINLQNFLARFLELKELLDQLYFLTRTLKQEYGLKTYTTKLSRHDLESISKKLPNRDKWQEESFTSVGDEICKEYAIGKNHYSKALNLIQSHPTFASHIGIEISLKPISQKDLALYLDAVEEIHAFDKKDSQQKKTKSDGIIRASTFMDSLFHYSELKTLKYNVIKNQVCKENIAITGALFHLGRDCKFSEYYPKLLEEQKIQISNDFESYLTYFLAKSNLRDNVIEGLKIMGQKTFLKELVT